MCRIFLFLVFRNTNLCNRIFERSGHVEIARHEVQTVRRMFQELKYQISNDLKCLVSRMRTGVVLLQN
jgi:hypothetical protein